MCLWVQFLIKTGSYASSPQDFQVYLREDILNDLLDCFTYQ